MALHHTMTCAECGEAFESVRSDAVTCSINCRMARLRKRDRARLGVLDRMTDAIRRGADEGVLRELAREAARLA